MLRTALLWLGALLVAGGIAVTMLTCTAAGLAPALVGAVLLLALLIERHRYKRIVDAAPGPEWQPTGERFIEPGNGSQVAVYYHQRTGQRSYVRVGGA